MDVITYALAKKMGGGGESITYTLTADTENKTIVLTPSKGTAQVITVPYVTENEVQILINESITSALNASY